LNSSSGIDCDPFRLLWERAIAIGANDQEHLFQLLQTYILESRSMDTSPPSKMLESSMFQNMAHTGTKPQREMSQLWDDLVQHEVKAFRFPIINSHPAF
jgi:hypothetical protein